ncbi:Hypothetical_protein [Hexamita inflata]|uniref:Hypothetical_protein n=1 Tax=Hexamita inflata TaxID=28002 RepID=A0AA86Q402_9EUKA|nr:Hypothetical protein HINF_LOCUS33262 [Hexamita inflata]
MITFISSLLTCLENIETNIDNNVLSIKSKVPKYEYCHIPNNAIISLTLNVGNLTLELQNQIFKGERGNVNIFQFPLTQKIKSGSVAKLLVSFEQTNQLQFDIWVNDKSVLKDQRDGILILCGISALAVITALLMMYG